MFTIKAGDLEPSMRGYVRAPRDSSGAQIDLTGATFLLVYKGRTAGRFERTAVNGGPDASDPTMFRWRYDWVAGDTDLADNYSVEIRATVAGRPLTLPNRGWASFEIEPRL